MSDLVSATLTVETMPVIAHQGIRVVTTDILARLYGTDSHNIIKNYRSNEDRFESGRHFIKLDGDELRAFKREVTKSDSVKIASNVNALMLWTERGSARHAKMLDTDAAWDVFEKLEDAYFRIPSATQPIPALPAIITTAQAGELATRLAERFPTGKDRPYAWSRFNRHFRLASYRDLPASRFDEACAYIPTMPVKDAAPVTPLAISGPIPLPSQPAGQRWLASHGERGWLLREVPANAYVLPISQWTDVIRHEPIADDDLVDLLSAVADRLSPWVRRQPVTPRV